MTMTPDLVSNAFPRILVVDDEPGACNLFKRVLEKMQYEVAVAGGVEEAIGKIGEFKPDLIISDVLMPQFSGYELIKMIQSRKPAIPMIMVSAVATKELKEECLENGAYAFMQKPIEFELLHKLIKKALNL
ncbi:hypothetical protein UZ36_02735 [Candidatus Nitromaritima sp. SCGC AAA799-C22]|nr:hypothetical protein UZ36_02735 [Candidatus Nitromaritima sp. SCGC AAA799-C22]